MVSIEDVVLLLEDDDEARTLLGDLLESEGYKVVSFSNGAEALKYLEHAELPCLVVLDLRMPVMDGAQFHAIMLKDPRLSKVPAIVVTAFDPSAAANLAVKRVLKKPVNVESLLRVIRQYC